MNFIAWAGLITVVAAHVEDLVTPAPAHYGTFLLNHVFLLEIPPVSFFGL